MNDALDETKNVINYFKIIADNKDKFTNKEFVKQAELYSELFARYDDFDKPRREQELNEYLAIWYYDIPTLMIHDIHAFQEICPVLFYATFSGLLNNFIYNRQNKIALINRDWNPLEKK